MVTSAMFQGLPRLKNYLQATMVFDAIRACEWTPEMRELWLLNAFENALVLLEDYLVY